MLRFQYSFLVGLVLWLLAAQVAWSQKEERLILPRGGGVGQINISTMTASGRPRKVRVVYIDAKKGYQRTQNGYLVDLDTSGVTFSFGLKHLTKLHVPPERIVKLHISRGKAERFGFAGFAMGLAVAAPTFSGSVDYSVSRNNLAVFGFLGGIIGGSVYGKRRDTIFVRGNRQRYLQALGTKNK